METVFSADADGPITTINVDEASTTAPHTSYNTFFKDAFLPARKDPQTLAKKAVQQFYERQNSTIDAFGKICEGRHGRDNSNEEAHRSCVSPAVLSFVVNVMLLVVKIIAVAASGSLSVISSLIDSALDLFSGVTIWYSERLQAKEERQRFPVGKSRLEPVAIIVIAAVMATAAFQIILTSVQRLVDGPTEPDLSTLTIVLIGVTVAAKLLLFLYCRQFSASPSAQALSVDHFNDSISNALALGFALWSTNGFVQADAIGAILISLIIIVNWFLEGRSHVNNLVGTAIEAPFHNLVAWTAWGHDPRIQKIDTVRGFRLGNNAYLEVDIVLPQEMQLGEAHDIGESLQNKLEDLEGVERAFVHLDVDGLHAPEHKYPS